MRLGVAREDRALFVIGGAIILGVMVIIALVKPRRRAVHAGFASTYATDNEGAKAAYLLLEKLGYHESRWTSPPIDLPQRASRVVLILADPYMPASSDDASALQWFVRRGGRVVATGRYAATLLGLPPVVPRAKESQDRHAFSPRLPGPISRGSPLIELRPHGLRINQGRGELEYYGDSRGAVVVRSTLGKGTIIWWGTDFPLSNRGIGRASDLTFFLNSVGPATGKQILWDEYFHGEQTGLWGYLARTPLGWALLQIGLVLLAALLTYSRRSGPMSMPAEESRLAPLEFVETVGRLYGRKRAASGAVQIALHRLQSSLTLRQKRTSSGASRRVVDADAEISSPGLTRLLAQCEAATQSESLEEATALELIQKLHDSGRALRLESRGD